MKFDLVGRSLTQCHVVKQQQTLLDAEKIIATMTGMKQGEKTKHTKVSFCSVFHKNKCSGSNLIFIQLNMQGYQVSIATVHTRIVHYTG